MTQEQNKASALKTKKKKMEITKITSTFVKRLSSSFLTWNHRTRYIFACADLEKILRGCPASDQGGPASDQGGSNNFLPFQNPYPGKIVGGPNPLPFLDPRMFCLYHKVKTAQKININYGQQRQEVQRSMVLVVNFSDIVKLHLFVLLLP